MEVKPKTLPELLGVGDGAQIITIAFTPTEDDDLSVMKVQLFGGLPLDAAVKGCEAALRAMKADLEEEEN